MKTTFLTHCLISCLISTPLTVQASAHRDPIISTPRPYAQIGPQDAIKEKFLRAMDRQFGGMVGGNGQPGHAGSSFSHVQSCSGDNAASGITSVSATCTSTIGAGHLLYMCLINYNSSGASVTYTISGDSGTVTTDIANKFFGLPYAMSCFYILSTSGGGTTITASSATNMNYTGLAVDEFVCPSCALDVSETSPATSTSGTTATSNSITTTASGDLVIGAMSFTTGSITAGSGYTRGAVTTWPALNEYKVQSSAGAVSASATGSSSTSWIAHVIAFK